MSAVDAPPDQAAELSALTASASQHYGQKKYDIAAELYSQATALQVEINGEMNPQNADLLYAYGRCLFQLGVSKSDVLGGKVAGEGKNQQSQPGKKRKREAVGTSEAEVAEKVVEQAVETKQGTSAEAASDNASAAKPFFQLSGDAEEWDDVSDEEADDEGAEADDEEDDLATAYEILDLARLLFEQQIEARIEAQTDPRASKELLADVHDLQAEISLENERFIDAISDSRASLLLKEELYPPEKGIVAEAHFKLSLALEFASVTVQSDENTKQVEEAQVDEGLRAEAASEMDAAIKCTRLRESKLKAAIDAGTHEKATAKDLTEIKEILQEMEQRLEDLKNPAVSINSAMGPAGAASDSNPLGGILGSILGETPAAQKARIEEAAKGANDLSGLVRRKQTNADNAAGSSKDKGKRKAADDDDERGKRAKTEET